MLANQSSDNSIPVFYNLFVNPDNQSDTPRVRQLVTEQLRRLHPTLHRPIYVHSIGSRLDGIPNTTLLGRHANGTEMVTLYSLWKYCHNHHTNDDHSVIYLHSKGSFHNRHENDLLRTFLTLGVVECTKPSMQDNKVFASSCDVCSSRFSPYPHPHTPGNMWVARCDYVRKLIDPMEFADRMEDVPRAKGLIPQRQWNWVGRGRYAAEHWIHSHPEVQPCDVYTGKYSFGYKQVPKQESSLRQAKNWAISMAPRFSYQFYGPEKKFEPWTGWKHRWSEYQVLYNQTPKESWWGWRINEWADEIADTIVVVGE